MAQRTVSVVVIGGSHAGLAVCQKLLRRTTRVHITLISPSQDYYFNIAAPRFLVKSNSLQQSSYLHSITDAFSEHSSDKFTFIRGVAVAIDDGKKTVSASVITDSAVTTGNTFGYDYLVIASGSTTPATLGQSGLKIPFKATAFEDTKAAIHEAQKKLAAADSIIIGGGGPLGVEMAGELAEAPGGKKIILVSQTDALLVGATPTVQKRSLALLNQKNVHVILGSRVESAQYSADAKVWSVKLASGRTITADQYIASTGVVPNNDFIPKRFLNAGGWVNVDDQLRVLQQDKPCSNIYALGDITMHADRLLSRVSIQGDVVAANIVAGMMEQEGARTYLAEAQRKMMVVPVGQSTGTGHFGGWTLMGCLVWYFKGKDFLVYEAPKFLRGAMK
ncbi:Pyridine nucleotide-disulfide oxidoreductase, NAD-binding domain protein [Cordyceps fumosorosea ARSEF 2679]|uniref:Pyridine nucleotide-disulfide oxidoreductase, NAD-binding domain protein n=1 Tax=Cordyceps fumosorosea (strain ARSEF 2679) TaxID=1081104 RepID=A0A167KSS1_CORFA|nr:Pyridine nucleotide-disulfide oxidoreductase, NAD-binding domain protein [Cordyceps fumosorosea ARSEF 2679]OAA52142.1 Pyridine nucleotide-disulfide oxidoreductase, NAD-binding domain protein [Cordyceps fumosorosea ARSEF 2679]